MKESEKEISYHIELPGIPSKRLPIDILDSIAKLTQKALRALATELTQPDFERGRRFPREIEKMIQLELIGFEDGSAKPIFGLARSIDQPQSSLLMSIDSDENLQDKVIDSFRYSIELVNEGGEDWKDRVPRRVWNPVKDLLSIPARTGATSFGIAAGQSSEKRDWIEIDKEAYKRIEQKLEEREAEEIVCPGVIREIDEKDGTAELHDPSGLVIKVTFDSELFEDIDAARWKPAHIIGKATFDPRKGLVKEIEAQKVIPQDIEQSIFWSEEILEEPGEPKGIVDYKAFAPFPEEFDFEGFMKAIEEA